MGSDQLVDTLRVIEGILQNLAQGFPVNADLEILQRHIEELTDQRIRESGIQEREKQGG